MTFAEIKAWLEEHKAEQDVADYLAGLKKLTPEGVKGYLDTDDGKKVVKPIVDAAVTRGIETWKTNNLDAAVEKLHNEKYPPEDDKDKELREIKNELQQIRTEKTKETLKSSALKKAVEKGLPVDIVDFIIGEDEDTTNTRLDVLETSLKAAIDAGVDARFKASGRKPEDGDPPTNNDPNPWKRETWNLTKQGAITRDDPERAKKLKTEAGVKT